MQYRIASVLALAGMANAAYKIDSSSAEVYPTSSAEASSSGYPVESYPASSSSSAATYSASSASTTAYTTSTIYSTNVYTITSCAPTVTNCPASSGKPHVTTEYIEISTTICPVTATEVKPSTYPVETAPSSSASVSKGTSSNGAYPTETPVYPTTTLSTAKQTYPVGTGSPSSSTKTEVGTTYTPSKPTASSYSAVPTAAAGRTEVGLGFLAAAGVAVALL